MKTIQAEHRRPTAAEWAVLVEESHSTPLSLRVFSEERGIPLQELYNRRSKLRRKHQNLPVNGFTPVHVRPAGSDVEAPAAAAGIEVRLCNGRTVSVSGCVVDDALLRQVIAAAQAVPC